MAARDHNKVRPSSLNIGGLPTGELVPQLPEVTITINPDDPEALRPLLEAQTGETVDAELERIKKEEAALSLRLIEEYAADAMRQIWYRSSVRARAYHMGYQYRATVFEELGLAREAPVTINVVYSKVQQAVTQLTAKAPTFASVAREDSDVQVANLTYEVLQYLFERNNLALLMQAWTMNNYLSGVGVLRAYIDPVSATGQPEIGVRSEVPERVYVAASSRDPLWRDSPHIIIETRISKRELHTLYPDLNESSIAYDTIHAGAGGVETEELLNAYGDKVTFSWLMVPTGRTYSEEVVILERYTRFMQPTYRLSVGGRSVQLLEGEEGLQRRLQDSTVLLMFSSGLQYLARDEEEAFYLQQFEALPPATSPDGEVTGDENMRLTIRQNPITGEEEEVGLIRYTIAEAIDSGYMELTKTEVPRIRYVLSVGGVAHRMYTMPISEYPVVPFLSSQMETAYPTGEAFIILSIQDAINRLHSLLIKSVATATSFKVILPGGETTKPDEIAREMQRAGVGVALAEYEGLPILASPSMAGSLSAITAHISQLVSMAEMVLGIYSQFEGRPDAGPPTFMGILQMNEQAQGRMAGKMRSLETSITHLGKVLLELFPHVYTSERTLRIFGSDNKAREVVLNKPAIDPDKGAFIQTLNNVDTLVSDVRVVPGSMIAYSRYAELDYLLRLLQVVGPALIPEILRKSEIRNWEDVLARADTINQLQAGVAQAQEEIERLKAANMQQERELVHARQSVEVAKFGADLDKLKDQATSATELFKARLADEARFIRENGKESSTK